MDVVLEGYFDNAFCKLNPSYLEARYKRRQLVDYLNSLIKVCVTSENCDEVTAVRHVVLAAMRYHQNSILSNGMVCNIDKCHNILYVAAKLCCDWQFNDNATVTRLLNVMYHCEQTFERLFVGAIFGIHVTRLISGWKSDFDSCAENLAAIEYFLKHATKAKLEYINGGGGVTRFIDIPMKSYAKSQPLFLATYFAKAEVLLLLLRYGASVVSDHETDQVSEAELLSRFQEFCVLSLPLPQTEIPLTCLKILLRAVPTVAALPSDPFSRNIRVVIGRGDCGVSRIYVHPRLLQEGVIPSSRSGLTPPELKHLSRCAIRNVLRENWQLPLGIRSLPIPSSIQDYLDLLVD
jgi:ankyrin repeat/SOCS box protein 17